MSATDPLAIDAADLLSACRKAGVTITSAESCTGGLIAAMLTEVAGSSDVFERGFVTYADVAKVEMLGVPAALIESEGAVSAAVASAMAAGALARSQADMAIAVTGIAGPCGGTVRKPVGLVHLAAARRGGSMAHREIRTGAIGRSAVRRATVVEAFALVRSLL